MITNVKLKNWRSHLDSEFNFSGGTNALLGSMGSGKSSTMDAICFAFFGTFPNLQTKKLKLDDVIMKKPSEKDEAEVEINFKVGDSIFSLKRIIEKGKGTTYSEIRENGKLLEAPNSQRVTEVVEKCLKVNYELFSKAIYSEQNAIDYFLTIPKGQRMKKIDELLSIDKFEKARSSSVSLANKIAERKSARQILVDQNDAKEIEKIVFEIKNSLTQAIEQKESISQELLKISQDKSEMEVELKQLESVKESWELAKREQSNVDSLIEETKKSLVSMQDNLKGKSKEEIEKTLEEMKSKLESLEKSLKEKRQIYEKTASSVNESKGKIEFLKKEKILVLEKEIQGKLELKLRFDELREKTGDNPSRQLDEKKRSYEKIISEFQELNMKIKDLSEVINYINSSEGLCPVCDTRLSEERKNLLIQQKQLKIAEFKQKLQDASQKKEISEKQLKTLEELSATLQQMFNEIK
ncbi:MAG: AAA family ATPase, partial [Candidatus Aenigmatarchaeota archaeon]